MRDRGEPCGDAARGGVDVVAVGGDGEQRRVLHGQCVAHAERLDQADGDGADEAGLAGHQLKRRMEFVRRGVSVATGGGGGAQEAGQSVDQRDQHLRALHHMPTHTTHRPMRSTRPAFQTASQLSLADSVR